METHLDAVMNEIVSTPNVVGCVFVDQQGLCLGAKGKVSIETSGVIAAIAEQAEKMTSLGGQSPVIKFENDNKVCIIQKQENVTGAIFKNNA